MSKKSSAFTHLWIAALLVLISFAIYGAHLGNPFVLDDEGQILLNPHVQSIENLPSFFVSSTFGLGGAAKMAGIYYKPLMTSYYATIWHFFGANPAAFRAPMVLLHGLTGFFIFLFSLRFLGGSRIWSFALAALFIVHPVNSEVVLYIADVQDVLYLFFGMASLVAVTRLKSLWTLIPTLLLLFTAAALSKETGVLFFAITTVYAFFFERKKLAPVFLSALAVFSVYLSVRFSLGFTRSENQFLIFHNAPYSMRLSMLPLILAHYLEILVAPWRLSIALDFIVKEFNVWNFWLPLGVCIVGFGAYVGLTTRLLREGAAREFAFFSFVLLLWFLLHTHVLLPLDGVYADRWLYLASWAVLSLVVIFAYHSLSHAPTRLLRGALAGFALVAIIFSARSFSRASEWSDALTLYQREAAFAPQDAIMQSNVGAELARRGRFAEAEPYFARAVELNPIWYVAWNNLGVVAERKRDDQKAAELYLKAMSLNDYSISYENYARLLLRNGRLTEARTFLSTNALQKFPYNSTLREIERYLQAQN